MEEGAGITNFKALKFETRTDAEKMQIEELVLSKMGKWKYSPDQLASQVSKELLERLQLRWESATQMVKDIYEKSLKNLQPSLTGAEVKTAMKNHEGKMMIRFHTCLILIKDIEHVVNDATNMWKNIYHLHKPSEDLVEIKDDYSSDSEDIDGTPSITVSPGELHALMGEGKEEEAEEEDKEEYDPIKIAKAVIASLPHSPQKTVSSTKEIASTSEIVSTITTSIAQHSLTSSQL